MIEKRLFDFKLIYKVSEYIQTMLMFTWVTWVNNVRENERPMFKSTFSS